jgi:hypothetical protein
MTEQTTNNWSTNNASPEQKMWLESMIIDTNAIKLDDRQLDDFMLLISKDLTQEQFSDLKMTLMGGDGIKMYHAIRRGKFNNSQHTPW